jgi:hypothetical protein
MSWIEIVLISLGNVIGKKITTYSKEEIKTLDRD